MAVVGCVRDEARGWEMPGGRVEESEDLLTALEREIAEETGCRVTVGRPLWFDALRADA